MRPVYLPSLSIWIEKHATLKGTEISVKNNERAQAVSSAPTPFVQIYSVAAYSRGTRNIRPSLSNLTHAAYIPLSTPPCPFFRPSFPSWLQASRKRFSRPAICRFFPLKKHGVRSIKEVVSRLVSPRSWVEVGRGYQPPQGHTMEAICLWGFWTVLVWDLPI